MPLPRPSSNLPPTAYREYQKISDSDWEAGVPLTELLERINRVAVHLAPEDDGQKSRVKPTFTERSYRHYTTLGCIVPAKKEGRRSVYRFRHFVQALTVRRLLWERVPSEQIALLMAGRGTGETERMFLGGTEMVARAADDRNTQGAPAPGDFETWRRVQLRPGVELHFREDLPKLRAADLSELLTRLEELLQRDL